MPQSRLLDKMVQPNKILNAIPQSVRIPYIVLEEPQGDVAIRSTIHGLLVGVSASGKDTILNAVRNAYYACDTSVTIYEDLTKPTLVGTIGKDRNPQVPVAWLLRHRTLLGNELRMEGAERAVEALCQVLDSGGPYQEYSRSIGFATKKVINVKDSQDLSLYLRIEEGNIAFRTRFACLVATMRRWRLTDVTDYIGALYQRLIPMPLEFTLDDDYAMLWDKIPFEKVDAGKQDGNPVVIAKDEWKAILKTVYDAIKSEGYPKDILKRTAGDIARLYAVRGHRDADLEEYVMRCRAEQLGWTPKTTQKSLSDAGLLDVEVSA